MRRPADSQPVQPCSARELRGLTRRLKGMRVTLMGLGLFGGGEGAAQFLVERGARLTVTDLRPPQRLAPTLTRLQGLGITYRLGRHVERDFLRTDLVVANPAVPRSSPFLHLARQAGVPIASPMNLFLTLCAARVAAVTGSNGKSTTTALLAAMLRSAGRKVWMGGNIGISLLPSLGRIAPTDLVVLELSSFQLEDTAVLGWAPHVAVVTNLTPNHLKRHRSFEAYVETKRGIVAFQGAQDFAVLNAADPIQQRWIREDLPGRLCLFDPAPRRAHPLQGVSLVDDCLLWQEGKRSELICRREEVPLLGQHNTENAMAAAAAARCLGASAGSIRHALGSFVGLEHRLELVGEFNGKRYYNDSYSTTPTAGVAAVRSFSAPLTLIAGGYDKGLDLGPLARAVAASVDVLVTFGQSGPFLARKARQEGQCLGRSLVVREAATLEEAIRAADVLSTRGAAVVFSPAGASYDMFENYHYRGRAFKEIIRQMFVKDRHRSKRA